MAGFLQKRVSHRLPYGLSHIFALLLLRCVVLYSLIVATIKCLKDAQNLFIHTPSFSSPPSGVVSLSQALCSSDDYSNSLLHLDLSKNPGVLSGEDATVRDALKHMSSHTCLQISSETLSE